MENKEFEEDPKIFWLDEFAGEAKGGYFLRSELSVFFNRLEDSGKTPVGIKVDDSKNLEILVIDKK